MRCLYRERRYVCGNYMEVDIFPVFKKQGRRGKRAKPTSEVQAKLNEHNAEQQLIRILNANFTGSDYEIHLTYVDENLPQTPDEAKRDAQNFVRRVKRVYQRAGISDLKYVLVPGGGIDGTRYHFHIAMTGGIDRSLIESLWGYGYANSKKLQFNENGIEGLGRYMARQFSKHKDELPFGKRWSGSRNLVIPKPEDRDGRLSQKKVQELATMDSANRKEFERLYEGYHLSEVRPFYNEVNGGYYLCIKMYRDAHTFSNTRKRKRKETVQNE